MTFNPYEIRKDFPILSRKVNNNPLIYFDNAATTQKPRQVINSIRDFYQNSNANVHGAIHTLSQESSEFYENAHNEIAGFINAKGIENIVFTRGTTEAINLVAYAWGLHNLSKNDEVMISLMEHHSNMVPWEILSRIRRFNIKYIDLRSDGTLNYESFENSISKNTKMICISHVSNVTGIINDINRITRIARDYGSLTLVDAAQSVPHLAVDVEELGVDFLAFSGHKMLGPTGIGVLYGKSELLGSLDPFQGGGQMVSKVFFDSMVNRCSIDWNVLPWKFEAGTPNISGAIGLAEAVRYLKRIGMKQVKVHEELLTEHAQNIMRESCKTVEIYGTEDVKAKCGIIPFNLGSSSSHDAALFLDNYGIMIRSGFHCAQPLHEKLGLNSSARASFYIYNTREEIDRFVEVLEEIEHF